MAQILACIKNFLPNCRDFSNQSTRGLSQIYPCEGPEGQPATLKPYVIDAPVNLIGRDLYNGKLRYTFHIFPRGHCSFNKQSIIKITWKNDEPFWKEQ